MADGPIRRKSEKAVRDRAGVPVGLLYDEANDKTIMQRGDSTGSGSVVITSPLESNGAIPVNIQDQHSRAFDLFFSMDVGSPAALLANTVEGSYVISCVTGHGLVATNEFAMFDPVTQHGHTAHVVSIAGDNTVNMDRPVQYILPSASTVIQERTSNMNVDGSSTRQVFSIGSPLVAELDIVRLMFQMTTTAVPTWLLFGDQDPLTRGVNFIQTSNTNGDVNHWNVMTNAELAHLMFDLNIYDAEHPNGINGLAGRLTYGSQGKHGVTLRIGGGEALQIVIQDDLEDLLQFRIMAQGHIVTD